MKSEKFATADAIKRLIPQREPFIMVDEIEASDDTHAVTALTVRADNYFMLPDGTMSETGLIEHIAQSCSALMGWRETHPHPLPVREGGDYSQDGNAAKDLSTPLPHREGMGVGLASHPPIGLIGEVKRFECQRRPRTGEKVSTSIEFGFTFGNVTIATGESRIGEELIAKAQLKIFMQQ